MSPVVFDRDRGYRCPLCESRGYNWRLCTHMTRAEQDICRVAEQARAAAELARTRGLA